MAVLITLLGDRPGDVPTNWEIYNAPRPIYGTRTWQGEFVTGRFYAAIDPADTHAAWMDRENSLLHAVRLTWVQADDLVTQYKEYIDARSKKTWRWDEYDAHDLLLAARTWLTSRNDNALRGR